ncbi:DNA alkylation repair protein [Corynebacterium sp. A21]|uniref:DNA alkylation repair protein n=1 Tax=Corynebacterium sp. A21 TaxID=3457318 RepID=UPI003FD5FEF4
MVTPPFHALLEALIDVADPARAPGMKAYMRDQFPFLGVSTPERRKASRGLLRGRRNAPDWQFVEDCWAAEEREFQYVACDHLSQVPLELVDLPCLKDLVIRKSWWDTVDALVKSIGRAGDAASMRAWAVDANFWVRRVAILHQLGRGANTDTVLLTEIILANLGSKEFFINKAIGWALRDYARQNPEWVRGFLAEQEAQLAPLSRREAAKHLKV